MNAGGLTAGTLRRTYDTGLRCFFLNDLRSRGGGTAVKARLPWLAKYLGYAGISGTQVYLTLTPDLLTAASARFARYAVPEVGRHD